MTEKLYDTDAYLSEFEAKVIMIAKEQLQDKEYNVIILDRTAFFPEGGGQSSDTGKIADLDIFHVQETDGRICHFVKEGETLNLKVGDEVTAGIDFSERFRKMQNHTAEHILCGLIHNRFGYSNVGFHLSEENVTFDIDGTFSDEEIAEIERLANETVYRNVPVRVSFPSSEELMNIEYRSKLEMTENVRLVTIEGIDVCACCAPHVSHTGEIGIIKIIDYFPHRGGTRFTMIAGSDAYKDYSALETINKKNMAVVSAKRYETAVQVGRLDEKCRLLLSENTTLKKRITQFTMDSIRSRISGRDTSDTSPFLIFSDELDNVQMRTLINECVTGLDCIIAGFLGDDTKGYSFIIAKKEENEAVNLKAFVKDFTTNFSGKGGGSDIMVQGSVAAERKSIEEYMKTYH